MSIGDPILVLPIYKRSEKSFRSHHERSLNSEKKDFDASGLPESYRLDWRDFWIHRLPWRYNDIIGYLEIQATGGYGLEGVFLLRRRCFPRQHPHRKSWGPQANQIVRCFGIAKQIVDVSNNESYVDAIRSIMRVARRDLRSSGIYVGTREAVILAPVGGFEHYNFARIHKAILHETEPSGA